MKKVLLTAALLAFGFSNAQEVKFGAKAGANLSMLSSGSKSKVGFHLGGVAEIKFNDKISLQPELMFSTEGGENSYNGDLGGSSPYVYNQEIKLNKIIMPVMFKYYVIPNLSLEVGPQLDYIVSGKSFSTLTTTDGSKITEDADMNNTSSVVTLTDPDGTISDTAVLMHDFGFKKLNFGLNFGAGYQLASGLFFQGRYNLGLTDFVTNANFLGGSIEGGGIVDPAHSGESFKNSNIQFSVGFKF